MEALAANLQADRNYDEDASKKKGTLGRCGKHSRHYEYWAIDIKELYCAKCVGENPPTKLILIEDAIPQIKAALALDVPIAKKKVVSVLEMLDEKHQKLVKNRNTFKEFIEAVQALDSDFKRDIEEVAGQRSTVLDTAGKLNTIDMKLSYFQTTADVHVIEECLSTLKKVSSSSSFSTSDPSQTLLYNIACSYVQEDAAALNHPSRALLFNAAFKGSPKTLLETLSAADQLEAGEKWTVDHSNFEAALLALADKQPSLLTLIEREDAPRAMPVTAFARAAKDCDVDGSFVDTFYSANNTTTDFERLEHILANRSLRLVEFFGHLDHSAISKLPHTIHSLGLAIGSAADAAAVSGLSLWQGLTGLRVSVRSSVAAKDLKPLSSGPDSRLYFPFLTDADVDFLRSAIEALVPDLRIYWLRLPKCQLTADGFQCLLQRLQGVKISCELSIEACGTWQPRWADVLVLKRVTGCSIVNRNIGWV